MRTQGDSYMIYNGLHFYSFLARADYNLRTGAYVPAWQKMGHTTHKKVKLSELNIPLTNYGMHSPAYVTTNEDWRFVGKSLAPRDKSVLTVAGSGDQPIAFALYGAKPVDTFDISYFPHVITDLKIAAIQTLDYEDYTNFVFGLRAAQSADDIYAFDKIATKCPRDTQNAIRQMNGCRIFKQGIGVYEKYMPNKFEYAMAKKNVTQPMDFIWSNVERLPGYINKKYDIVYLSNIFDYYREDSKIKSAINALRPALTDNGCVAIYMFADMPFKAKNMLLTAVQNCELKKVDFHESDNGTIITLAKQQLVRQRVNMRDISR